MGNKSLKKELNEIASQKLFYKKIVYIPEIYRGINNIVAFESVDGICYLIYSTLKGSIISYNFVANQIINEIKIATQFPFSIFRHYSDIKNHRDLLLCMPEIFMDIKIFEIKNFNCILNLTNIYKSCSVFASCFFSYFDQIYFMTAPYTMKYDKSPDYIKIFDLKGNIIKEINDSNKDRTIIVLFYYDKKVGTNFIVTGNEDYIKIYDYDKNKVYRKYSSQQNLSHCRILIYEKEEKILLLDSCGDGRLRIWDFHSGKLINKIKVSELSLSGISFYNDSNIFIGSSDNHIYLFNLKYGIIIDKIPEHKTQVSYVKKITSKTYGDFLISKGREIIVWRVKDKL